MIFLVIAAYQIWGTHLKKVTSSSHTVLIELTPDLNISTARLRSDDQIFVSTLRSFYSCVFLHK